MSKRKEKPKPRPKAPSGYDAALAKEICERVATGEDGLERILKVLTEERGKLITPCLRTIFRWLRDNKDFQTQMATARTLQAQVLFDRVQHYIREPLIGTVTREEKDKDGNTKKIITTSDNVERSKLLATLTLKRAGMLDPEKYSDRTMLAGDPKSPIGLTILSSIPRPNRTAVAKEQ